MQPGPPNSPYSPQRDTKTWPIVLILIAAVVVIGGGTVAFAVANNGGGNSADEAGGITSGTDTNAAAPSSTSAPPSSTDGASAATPVGRYQTLPDCSALNGGSFSFGAQPALPQGVVIGQNCYSTGEIDGSWVMFTANMQVFDMSDAISQAEQAAKDSGGQQVSEPGFENAPYVGFGVACVFDYSRSNEEVELEFMSLPGVSDAASCASVALPYATQYYNLIG